jgi:hypothetical protein
MWFLILERLAAAALGAKYHFILHESIRPKEEPKARSLPKAVSCRVRRRFARDIFQLVHFGFDYFVDLRRELPEFSGIRLNFRELAQFLKPLFLFPAHVMPSALQLSYLLMLAD